MPQLTDNMIKVAQQVMCPKCGAAVGEPCKGKAHMARNQALPRGAYGEAR